MEQAADSIVTHLYDRLIDRQSGETSSVLVRFFKTHPFSELTPALQKCARDMLGSQDALPNMKCLLLLATAGLRPEWNDRAKSAGHQAIPLPSSKAVERIPMISQLIQQFGLSVGDLLAPAPELLLELAEREYNVFFVPDAKASPYIPAQAEFVIPMSVRSVLGFGGLTPSGELFAIIVFSRSAIHRDVASMFKTIALSARLAILPFDGRELFQSNAVTRAAGGAL
jgi:hypothetical protein